MMLLGALLGFLGGCVLVALLLALALARIGARPTPKPPAPRVCRGGVIMFTHPIVTVHPVVATVRWLLHNPAWRSEAMEAFLAARQGWFILPGDAWRLEGWAPVEVVQQADFRFFPADRWVCIRAADGRVWILRGSARLALVHRTPEAPHDGIYSLLEAWTFPRWRQEYPDVQVVAALLPRHDPDLLALVAQGAVPLGENAPLSH